MKTGKERRDQERERAEEMARILAEYLTEHKAWNWNWPGSGSLDDPVDLQRNCWFTNNPKPKYPKAPGAEHVVEGPQTYYSKHLRPNTGKRWHRRKSRRQSPRLQRAGLKFGRAHSYPGRMEAGF